MLHLLYSLGLLLEWLTLLIYRAPTTQKFIVASPIAVKLYLVTDYKWHNVLITITLIGGNMQDNKPHISDPHDTLIAPTKATYIPPYVTKLITNPNTSNKRSTYIRESGYDAPS
jgi:hypothetical protein